MEQAIEVVPVSPVEAKLYLRSQPLGALVLLTDVTNMSQWWYFRARENAMLSAGMLLEIHNMAGDFNAMPPQPVNINPQGATDGT